MADKQKSSTAPPKPNEVNLPSPLLLETMRAAAQVGAILLALIVFVVSAARGVDPFTAGVRAAVALFAGGVVGWLAVYWLGCAYLRLLAPLKPKEEETAVSTQSWEA